MGAVRKLFVLLCVPLGCARAHSVDTEVIHADPAKSDAHVADASPPPPAAFVAKQVSIGDFHTCAVTPDGSVMCWGRNTSGELGNGTDDDHRSTPVRAASIAAVEIALGGSHSCALTTAGGVSCWGNNFKGQLGDGTTLDRKTPVPVAGLSSGVASIAASHDHTCAVMTTGAIKCWGKNESGELGDGTKIERHRPTTVSGISNARAVTVGGCHACALTTEGAVLCWGDGHGGTLGDGTNADHAKPVGVVGLGSGAR